MGSVAPTWIRSPVNNHLIEHLVRPIWPMSVLVIPFFPDQLLDKVPQRFLAIAIRFFLPVLSVLSWPRVRFLAAHNRCFKSQPQTDCDSLAESVRQNPLMIFKVKLGKEPKAPQRKTQHRR